MTTQTTPPEERQDAPLSLAEKIVLPEDIERVMVGGDLKALDPGQRVEYVRAVCRSLGLNHLTRPFEYVLLQGRLTLYARKDATDQLRRIYGVSVTKVEEEWRGDLLIVRTYVEDRTGRKDQGRAAVVVGSLKGEALCNALMKAETKSKRRATLSLCGLGFLDETEVDSVDHAPVDRSKPQETTLLDVGDTLDPDDDLLDEPLVVARQAVAPQYPEATTRSSAEDILNLRMEHAGVSEAELDDALTELYGEDTAWTSLEDAHLIRLANQAGWERVFATIQERRAQ